MNSLLYKLRALYRGLLWRGQNRIVIVSDTPDTSQDEPPIFLIGCTRSGTSLLRRIVDSHSRIACPPESYFMKPLLKLLQDEHALWGLESMGFQKDAVLTRLRSFISQFFSDYAKAKGKPRWADKTPLYIDCLDAIDELYQGKARYIMIYRHGLDVAYSMSTVLPQFVNEIPNYSSDQETRDMPRVAAAYWRDQVTKMRNFQASHSQQCFGIRYEELAEEPASVLPEMFNFLGEEFEESVLNFNKSEHDEGMGDSRAAMTKGFVPSVKNYQKWQPAELSAALEEIDALLSEMDYSV